MSAASHEDETVLPEQDQVQDEEDLLKRRRIARACDMCRKKKIRCDGDTHRCNCVAYQTECIFTDAPKKRAPPRGARYIQNLEERLHKMEQLLHRASSGVHLPSAAVQSGSSRNSPNTIWHNTHTDDYQAEDTNLQDSVEEAQGQDQADRDAEELAERMGVLFQQSNGEVEYLGASNTITSLLSARRQIREILGDDSFDTFCRDSRKSFEDDERKSELDFIQSVGRVKSSNKYHIPDRATCQNYIDLYFAKFQSVYPLLDEADFNEQCPQMHEAGRTPDLAFSSIYLMVIAFGSHIANQQPLGPDHAEGFNLYAHAYHLLSVIVNQTSLPVVQAFILVSLYLDGVNRAQALWTILGPLVRMAQSLGLHRRLPLDRDLKIAGPGRKMMDNQLLEARRRAFWIIYLIDNNLVVATGKPAAIQDFDCDQELPTMTPVELAQIDGCRWADGTPFDFFLAQIQLAKLSHQVQKRLYCVRALESLSGDKLEAVVAELDAKLLAWLQTLPEEFRPENTQTVFNQDPRTSLNSKQVRPLYLDVMIPIIHLRYFNLMMTIHRRNMFSTDGTSTPGPMPLSPGSGSRASSSHSIAVHAARSSLAVLSSRVPRMEDACMKMNIAYPVAALLVLFASLIRNPGSPTCNDDVQIMRDAISYISVRFENDSNTRRLVEFFNECIKVSELAIAKTHQQGTKRELPTEASSEYDSSRAHLHEEASTQPVISDFNILAYYGMTDLAWATPERLHDPYAFGDFTGMADPFGRTQDQVLQPNGCHFPSHAAQMDPYTGFIPMPFPAAAENHDHPVDDDAFWNTSLNFASF